MNLTQQLGKQAAMTKQAVGVAGLGLGGADMETEMLSLLLKNAAFASQLGKQAGVWGSIAKGLKKVLSPRANVGALAKTPGRLFRGAGDVALPAAVGTATGFGDVFNADTIGAAIANRSLPPQLWNPEQSGFSNTENLFRRGMTGAATASIANRRFPLKVRARAKAYHTKGLKVAPGMPGKTPDVGDYLAATGREFVPKITALGLGYAPGVIHDVGSIPGGLANTIKSVEQSASKLPEATQAIQDASGSVQRAAKNVEKSAPAITGNINTSVDALRNQTGDLLNTVGGSAGTTIGNIGQAATDISNTAGELGKNISEGSMQAADAVTSLSRQMEGVNESLRVASGSFSRFTGEVKKWLPRTVIAGLGMGGLYLLYRVYQERNKQDDRKSEKAAMTLAQQLGKQAYAGNQGFSFQPYSPQLDQRELSQAELKAVDQGQDRWLPRIFQSYGTPVPEMMSSPGKGALLGGLGGAAVGGGLGAAIGNGSPAGAGLGAAGGGALGALLTYFSRKAHNEGLQDMMGRLPENPRKRDLLSDPAYQKDLDRSHQDSNMRMLAMNLQNAMATTRSSDLGGSAQLGKQAAIAEFNKQANLFSLATKVAPKVLSGAKTVAQAGTKGLGYGLRHPVRTALAPVKTTRRALATTGAAALGAAGVGKVHDAELRSYYDPNRGGALKLLPPDQWEAFKRQYTPPTPRSKGIIETLTDAAKTSVGGGARNPPMFLPEMPGNRGFVYASDFPAYHAEWQSWGDKQLRNKPTPKFTWLRY